MASNMKNRKKPKPVRPKTKGTGLISKVRSKLGGGKPTSAFGLGGQKRTMNKPTPSKPPASKTKPSTGPLASRSYKKTKGGDYPVYKKSSAEAGSFRSAYSMARKAKAAGKNVKGGGNAFSYNAKTNVFTWKGKKYKAESAGEKTKREAASKARKNKTTQSPVKRNKVSYSAASKTDKRRTRGPAAAARKTTKRYGGGQGGF